MARRYERTEGRKDTRAGSYDRQLHTKAGENVKGGVKPGHCGGIKVGQ